MKNLFIALVSLTTAASAFAKPASINLAQLESDAKDAAMGMEGADGCGFDASVHAGVLVLRMTEGKKQISVEVKQDEKITLVDRAKGTDDSDKVYRMPNGELEVLRASDAFNRVSLTDAQGTSLSCEVDF